MAIFQTKVLMIFSNNNYYCSSSLSFLNILTHLFLIILKDRYYDYFQLTNEETKAQKD